VEKKSGARDRPQETIMSAPKVAQAERKRSLSPIVDLHRRARFGRAVNQITPHAFSHSPARRTSKPCDTLSGS
jgi:uncharacterized NAD(P)/FAD-binding protein YdhS